MKLVSSIIAILILAPGLAFGDVVPEPEMVRVPGGTFTMGRRADEPGDKDELPRHEVTLSSYEIGKFEVTNADYAAALNWAYGKGYVRGGILSVRFRMTPLKKISPETDIAFDGNRFRVMERDGLPMEEHPVSDVTWFGAVAYANWLSEMHGLEPCYDQETWSIKRPVRNGYRLPTEAEWERAAGWEAGAEPARWAFTFGSDTASNARLNFGNANPLWVQGLNSSPKTSTVGYYDGKNPETVDSPSPAGVYDMGGNVYEWCSDWYDVYTDAAQTDPLGPVVGPNFRNRGPYRVLRGGGWASGVMACRVSNRAFESPGFTFRFYGFRLARNAE